MSLKGWGAEAGTEPACFTRKLQLHILPRELPVHSPQITGGRDRAVKREVSTCIVTAEMATLEACKSSLGEGSDWIKDTEPQKV